MLCEQLLLSSVLFFADTNLVMASEYLAFILAWIQLMSVVPEDDNETGWKLVFKTWWVVVHYFSVRMFLFRLFF